jgi:hypothetical protein
MRNVPSTLGAAVCAAFALLPVPVPADTAPLPALKVLRHLTFAIDVDVERRTDTNVSGIGGPPSGIASNTGTALGHGTIAVDVVAATGDGGIVLDISEDTDARKFGTVRAAVLGSTVSYDASKDVSLEEREVLRLLSRSFVKDGEIAVGTAWTAQAQGNGDSESTTYTVTALDADTKTIDIAVAGTMAQKGADGFDGTTSGSVRYDMGTLVPLQFSLHVRKRTQPLGQVVTVDTKLTATLTSDSFRKPAS